MPKSSEYTRSIEDRRNEYRKIIEREVKNDAKGYEKKYRDNVILEKKLNGKELFDLRKISIDSKMLKEVIERKIIVKDSNY